MIVTLEQKHRARPQDGLQDGVAPGRDRVPPVGREQLPQRWWIGDEDHLARAEDPKRERLAEAATARFEERHGPGDEPERLNRGGRSRAGREPHAATWGNRPPIGG